MHIEYYEQLAKAILSHIQYKKQYSELSHEKIIADALWTAYQKGANDELLQQREWMLHLMEELK